MRTKHIRLGAGVVSPPYHHLLTVADRWVLLDHLTCGRVMFGTGPGALPSDAYMMGINPIGQRRMMQESLEAILACSRTAPGEHIDRHFGWFTLRDAAPAAATGRSRTASTGCKGFAFYFGAAGPSPTTWTSGTRRRPNRWPWGCMT